MTGDDLARVPEPRRRILRVIDGWKFWMVVAYLALAALSIFLYANARTSSDALARTVRDETVHQAERQAARNAAVARCLSSRPALRKINGFVAAVRQLHEVIDENSRTVLQATPRSDPTYQARRRAYVRVHETLPAIETLRFPVPTEAECRLRGRR